LLAQHTNGNGGSNLGQDILLAGLGAGEKAFELANEPEVVREGYDHYNYRDSSYDPDRSRYDNNFYEPNEFSYGTRKSDEASLITGAAEGAFSTTKSRLENRSIQIDQERASENPIFQLEAGTDVSIFVNSFLTIER
jgi:hypothetical protein